MLFAMGILLPFLTGQIPEIGNMLLPMHIPVLLAGFAAGPLWGLAVGASLPIVRSLMFSRPVLFPSAVAMAAELATYAFVVGILYSKMKKSPFSVYFSLVTAMIAGRVVWGGVMALLMLGGVEFGWGIFISSAITEAIPGIIIQLVLIPIIILALRRSKLWDFD